MAKKHNPLTVRGAHLNMINAHQGGMSAMALLLGDASDVRLRNQAYELKGMAVPTERSLMIQEITGRTDFAEAIAYLSGGVFVAMPADDLVGGDINELFMECIKELGSLAQEFQTATADGVVDARELKRLTAIKTRLCAQAAGIIKMTEQVFCEKTHTGECDGE